MEGDCISLGYIRNTKYACLKHIHRDRGHQSKRYGAGTGFGTLGSSIVLKYLGILRKAYFPSAAISDYVWTVEEFMCSAKRGQPPKNIGKALHSPVWGSSALSFARPCISHSNLRVPLLVYRTPESSPILPPLLFFHTQSTLQSA